MLVDNPEYIPRKTLFNTLIPKAREEIKHNENAVKANNFIGFSPVTTIVT